ncbi:hypothetical protein SteCoe_25957 [Stentor coeruleus]|uniref:Peptidase M16 C-terminal domain-containing protein n=1 Tax=Stentor coeruleus TaxID=5963 RepID=A0A1R2BDZ0_9CILI|nr:hypothetical protein SteCoe_25957 [Stentor coeruleus]
MIRRLIHSSFKPLPNHHPIYVKDFISSVQKSKLSNGVKIITESQKFPSTVNIGIVIQVGTRDDPIGYLNIYKELFLKSRIKADQMHYLVLDLLGCNINLLIERENIYINTSCLEDHLKHVIPALKHAIFHLKNPEDTSEAIEKFNSKLEPESKEDSLKNFVLPTSYSNKTLGIRCPRITECKLENDDLEKFLKKKFTAEKTTIAATGITDHKTFESLVAESFSNLDKGRLEFNPAIYTGGTYRENIDDNDMIYMCLGFQAAGFFEHDMATFTVIKSIIGDGGGFNIGGPGKGMRSRTFTKFLIYDFLKTVKSYNHAFTDSGVFALSLVGFEKYAEYMPEIILNELYDLAYIQEEELNRAKNIITREALINYQRSLSRLEDLAKNCAFFYNTPDEFGYLKKISQVSVEDIRRSLLNMFTSQFSMIVLTDKNTKIPDLETIYKRMGRK